MRVQVIRAHVLGRDRYATEGELLDLETYIAKQRILEGYCIAAPVESPATPAPASGPTPGDLGSMVHRDPTPVHRDPEPAKSGGKPKGGKE